jgi:hypothetical protein
VTPLVGAAAVERIERARNACVKIIAIAAIIAVDRSKSVVAAF